MFKTSFALWEDAIKNITANCEKELEIARSIKEQNQIEFESIKKLRTYVTTYIKDGENNKEIVKMILDVIKEREEEWQKNHNKCEEILKRVNAHAKLQNNSINSVMKRIQKVATDKISVEPQ